VEANSTEGQGSRRAVAPSDDDDDDNDNYIFCVCVCVCSLSCPASKAHVLYYIIICCLYGCTIFFHIIS
jgi:hypothetical protein